MRRHVVRWALLLIAAQLALRGGVAFTGGFYFDDVILSGRAGTTPLLSTELLLYDHDGHLMPAAFLLAGALTHLAPLQWWLPALSLLLLQAVASLAVLRLLLVLLGRRPLVLAPLLLYLLSPLSLPSFAWWAAALNSLPMQAALAWVCADAVQLVRTGRRRYAASGAAAFVVGLAFFEKSVIVAGVALAVAVLVLRVDGAQRPVRSVLRRGAVLWLPLAGTVLAWAVLYVSVVGSPTRSGGTLEQAMELMSRGVGLALLPSLIGGPWSWDQLGSSTPFATPGTAFVVAGWLALAVVVGWSLTRRRRTGWVWALFAAYVGASLGAMLMGRLTANTPVYLPQTLRYLADSAVVAAVVAALVLRAPSRRPRQMTPGLSSRHRAMALTAAGAFVVSSVVSTVAFGRLWTHSVTHDYVVAASRSLAQSPTPTLLDHPVPGEVLWPEAHPHNLAARVFGPLRRRPVFADHSLELRLLDDRGQLVPAKVVPSHSLLPGPNGACGHLVAAEPVALPLSGEMIEWEWTVELGYLAAGPGRVEVALGSGEPVTVEVVEGLGQVFVRLTGGGDRLHVRPASPDLALCIDRADVGKVEPVQAAP